MLWPSIALIILSTFSPSYINAQLLNNLFRSNRLSSFGTVQSLPYAAAYSIVGDPRAPDEMFVCGAVMGGSKLSPTSQLGAMHSLILKMHNNGSIIWYRVLGGSENSYCFFLTISEITGNLNAIFISKTMDFSGESIFKGSSTTNSNSDSWISFIYSFSATTGAIVWGRNLVLSGGQSCAFDIAEILPRGGSLFVSGMFGQDLTKNPDAFIVRLNPNNGEQIWMSSFGGPYRDFAQAMASDGENLAVLGSISGDLDGQKFFVASSTTCFLTWYTPNGTRLTSRTRLFGSTQDGCMISIADYHPPTNDLLIGGAFTTSTLLNRNSIQWQGFAGRISATDGTVKYLRRFSDSIYSSLTNDQVLLSDGRWIMCGQTTGQFDDTNRMYGGNDLFLLSVRPEDGSIEWTFTWGTSGDDACNSLLVFPKNPDANGNINESLTTEMLYSGGGLTGGNFGNTLLLTVFNMTELDLSLPFQPLPPPANNLPSNNAPQPTQPNNQASSAMSAALIGAAIAGVTAILLAGILIVTLKRRVKSSRQPNETYNLDTLVHPYSAVTATKCEQSQQATSRSTVVATAMNDEATAVPTFMGISIPGGHYIDELRSICATKSLFKNFNCEVYVGTALSGSVQSRCNGKPIVIKRFLCMKSQPAKDAFIQELSLMYLFVNNDLFVRLYGYHERPYLMVMKYYEGGSLEQFLFDRRPQDFKFLLPTKLKFTLQISKAVSAMHCLGLAHADLKLLNVFVDIVHPDRETGEKDYNCVLGDFGLASILDQSKILVRAYQVHNRRGLTVAYAAPEVINRFKLKNMVGIGNDSNVIKAGDLFAFGIMQFEILDERKAWRT